MNKFLTWFNERAQTEKIGLILLVLAGVGFFLYQIYKQSAKIDRLEKELREIQNLQAYYFEKKRLEKKLKELEEGINFYKLSYEDIYNAAYKNNITILEAKKLKVKKFSVNISGEKVILSSVAQKQRPRRERENRQKKSQQRRRTIVAEPVNLKLMGNKEKMLTFLEEITRDKLVALGGFYGGCITETNFKRLEVPPNICSMDARRYKDWLCSKVNRDKFYITLLLLHVGE